MKRRVADIIMDILADNGIEQAFCVVGGGSMYLNNALGISKRIKTIYNHHEQACAMAADGYARYTMNKPALVCVTSGPGGTNTLTGVYGAYVDSIPMIVISGQCRYNTSVPDSGLPLRTRGVQEFNIVDTVKTMTKYSKLVTNPLEIKREVQKAYDIAMSGRRGPVWLDIPQNVQNAMVEEADLLPVELKPEVVSATSEEIAKVLQLLKQAKRPVIMAGSGINSGDAKAEFLKFFPASEFIKLKAVSPKVKQKVVFSRLCVYEIFCNREQFGVILVAGRIPFHEIFGQSECVMRIGRSCVSYRRVFGYKFYHSVVKAVTAAGVRHSGNCFSGKLRKRFI